MALDAEVLSYVSHFDAKVFRAQMRVTRKKGFGRIVLGGFVAGIGAFVIWAVMYFCLWIFTFSMDLGGAFLCLSGLMIVTGFLAFWQYVVNLTEETIKFATKDQPTASCRILSRGFEIERPNGVILTIPWALMKVDLETDEAWTISYGKESLVVFRKPLRESGFEAEFLSRVGKSS